MPVSEYRRIRLLLLVSSITICMTVGIGLGMGGEGAPQPAVPGYSPVMDIELAGRAARLIMPEDTSMFPNEIPLVVFSAGAGSQGMDTRNRIHMLARAFAERDIRPAILTTRYANHISPGADKGVQLIEAIDAAAEQYNTSRRFFLTGFSRGGQFTQRFVFHAAPERVFAAVPCNPGSWTMPQGGNLHRSDNEHGMDTHPLGTPMPDDAEGWSEAQWDASLQPALPAARQVPMLILCTKGDSSRLPLAKKMPELLQEAGWVHVSSCFDIPGGHRFRQEIAHRVADFFIAVMLGTLDDEGDE